MALIFGPCEENAVDGMVKMVLKWTATIGIGSQMMQQRTATTTSCLNRSEESNYI